MQEKNFASLALESEANPLVMDGACCACLLVCFYIAYPKSPGHHQEGNFKLCQLLHVGKGGGFGEQKWGAGMKNKAGRELAVPQSLGKAVKIN